MYSNSYIGDEISALNIFGDTRWDTCEGTTQLNYKFISALPSYYAANADESNGLVAFNNQMITATYDIFQEIESFANISFTATNNENSYATLTLATATLPVGIGGWAYLPTPLNEGGDVWINNFYADTVNPIQGNYAYYLLMHEIGHAIGLEHSFDSFTGNEATSRFSVMAYDTSPGLPQTFMLYDIAALQSIYGANMSHALGDDTYAVNAFSFKTIWDAGGKDTFNALFSTIDSVIDLTPGSFSSITGNTHNVAIAFNVIIENAIAGAGNDTLIGNDVRNDLRGNGGNDTLYGAGGDDLLYGGSGLDVLYGEDGIDRLYGNDGNDILHGGNETDYLFAHNGHDKLHGDDGADYLYGGNGDDILHGGSGDDFIYGNNDNDILNDEEGDDTLNGGIGNDRLIGNNGDDTLNGDAGNDTIYGGSGSDIINGGAGDDFIYGQSGNDILYGGGGKDHLYGQSGMDIFILDALTDINTVIWDFNIFDDLLDLSGVLSAYDALTDSINDFLQVTQRTSSSTIGVDTDGADNGANFSIIGQVKGINGLDAEDLENDGLLII